MALLFAEKFAKYATQADVASDNSGWVGGNATNGIETAFGRFGDNCLRIRASAGHYTIPWLALTASDTTIIGASVRLGAGLQIEPRTIFALVDATSAFHWAVQMSISGFVTVVDSNDMVVAMSAQPLGYGVWHWIEVKATATGAGNVEVRVDGVQVINVAGDFLDGTADPLTSLRFGGVFNTEGFHYDELIVMDGTGATFNDFLGDMRIEASVVDADGSIVDWTASAGTDVSCVDDALGAYNDDTDYVSSSTTDQDEYFSHATVVAPGHTDIIFAGLTALVRDDGANTFRLQVNSGGTIDRSPADINPSTVYQWSTYVWGSDPDTVAPWVLADLNAAEFGLRCRP